MPNPRSYRRQNWRTKSFRNFNQCCSACTKSGSLLNSSLHKELKTLLVLLRKIFQDEMLCYFELLSLIHITLKQIQIIKEVVLISQGRNYVKILSYTGCPRRKVPNLGRVFLMLNYTDITQNTYIQSWTVTEIMTREVWNFDSCYTLTDYQIHIKTGRNMWFL